MITFPIPAEAQYEHERKLYVAMRWMQKHGAERVDLEPHGLAVARQARRTIEAHRRARGDNEIPA